jgi:glycosyltransferase involved in cell wall biosynthesis
MKASDMCVPEIHSELAGKSSVIYPPINFNHIDGIPFVVREDQGVPVIVWNHRWEHDKNPEEFFGALRSLALKDIDFKLILLGQSFSTQPQCFADAREYFRDRIIHCGYVESATEYAELLKKGDIVISTSRHEFFGISVLEAVRAGCLPLLPRRLSYPELFPEKYLYDEGMLEEKLTEMIRTRAQLGPEVAKSLTEPYSLTTLAGHFHGWLVE